jgi:hypothetical protein
VVKRVTIVCDCKMLPGLRSRKKIRDHGSAESLSCSEFAGDDEGCSALRAAKLDGTSQQLSGGLAMFSDYSPLLHPQEMIILTSNQLLGIRAAKRPGGKCERGER